MKYNVMQGYAQQRHMSARFIGKNKKGQKLYRLLSISTGDYLTEPMTIEEFNIKRKAGETFYKRYFQPSLLKLVR